MSERAGHSQDLLLEPSDNHRLADLCGPFDQHLRQIEKRLDVQLSNRGNQFRVSGEPDAVAAAAGVLESLYRDTLDSAEPLAPARVHLYLQEAGARARRPNEGKITDSHHDDGTTADADAEVDAEVDADANVSAAEEIVIRTRRGLIRARGDNQQHYLRNILTHDINFGVGPAGTGKTYLAVACAVEALERDEARRLVLVRPAVEAGERLGFLPGDLVQKVDPYLRPLYDALYEMMGFEKVGKLIERNVIEVAPLAFMRGRTLNESFIILDEAQNTTAEQMKMFLTRIGFGATAVITGDVTQVDLPRNTESGLKQALGILNDVDGISITHFGARDVVRHPLVQRIVSAYGRFEQHKDSENRRDPVNKPDDTRS